ncbi:hypothetical protein F511_06920 [Dorcoceras hygrometricum]|uniref:Uncharacterized protein n=1 Tax=Dorcoceras hygrometricum TaxID=472368 RepID=A0A2Z7B2C3_9LAMI|nr:hypothetical protein F511_06920 [Dorcoceras hygrometricum]
MADMKVLFSTKNVPFKPSSKKKDMKVEYRILNDIVAKSMTTKAGYVVQLNILLDKLVKVDLWESMALHPLKVLNIKSVLTYLKTNQASVPAATDGKKYYGDKEVSAELNKKQVVRAKQAAGRSAAPAQSCSKTISDTYMRSLVKLVAPEQVSKPLNANLFLCHLTLSLLFP